MHQIQIPSYKIFHSLETKNLCRTAKTSHIKLSAETQAEAFHLAYNYYNYILFQGKLNDCIITFGHSSMRKISGCYCCNRWEDRNGEISLSEIFLNPKALSRDLIHVFSTLVHEMAHHYQYMFGNPGRAIKYGYHNLEFRNMMLDIGLQTSSTGIPGGQETGVRMSHYILENGAYKSAFDTMPKEIVYPFVLASPETEINKIGKQKLNRK